MIWTHTEDELRTFITYLNNIHPAIKFTSSHSATSACTSFSTSRSHSASLVRLRPISIQNRQTSANTFYNHRVTPVHTKRTNRFSLALQLRRICFSDESFTLRANGSVWWRKGHFFKLQPQQLRDLYVHFRKSKPSSAFKRSVRIGAALDGFR